MTLNFEIETKERHLYALAAAAVMGVTHGNAPRRGGTTTGLLHKAIPRL